MNENKKQFWARCRGNRNKVIFFGKLGKPCCDVCQKAFMNVFDKKCKQANPFLCSCKHFPKDLQISMG